jgi:hypothetical protein
VFSKSPAPYNTPKEARAALLTANGAYFVANNAGQPHLLGLAVEAWAVITCRLLPGATAVRAPTGPRKAVVVTARLSPTTSGNRTRAMMMRTGHLRVQKPGGSEAKDIRPYKAAMCRDHQDECECSCRG